MYMKGRSFSPPPQKILSLQYISNYIGKIVQTRRSQSTHCNISQNCVSKCTRLHLSAYSFQNISGENAPGRPGISPPNDNSCIEPWLSLIPRVRVRGRRSPTHIFLSFQGWRWKQFRQIHHPSFWVCSNQCKSGCGSDLTTYSHCNLGLTDVNHNPLLGNGALNGVSNGSINGDHHDGFANGVLNGHGNGTVNGAMNGTYVNGSPDGHVVNGDHDELECPYR